MPGRFDRLLRNIRVYGGATSTTNNGTLIARYQLEHTISLATGNSLLAAFRQFGSDGDSGGASLEPKMQQLLRNSDLAGPVENATMRCR